MWAFFKLGCNYNVVIRFWIPFWFSFKQKEILKLKLHVEPDIQPIIWNCWRLLEWQPIFRCILVFNVFFWPSGILWYKNATFRDYLTCTQRAGYDKTFWRYCTIAEVRELCSSIYVSYHTNVNRLDDFASLVFMFNGKTSWP